MVTVIIHLDFSWMLRVVVDFQDDFFGGRLNVQ